ncbi:MAG: hypothetical protein P4M08_03895 [Oligoflexia bacterium]|nr:hypothetical protein [Oligoflexia bacterium]
MSWKKFGYFFAFLAIVAIQCFSLISGAVAKIQKRKTPVQVIADGGGDTPTRRV